MAQSIANGNCVKYVIILVFLLQSWLKIGYR